MNNQQYEDIGIFEYPEDVDFTEEPKDRLNRGEQLTVEEQDNLSLASCDWPSP